MQRLLVPLLAAFVGALVAAPTLGFSVRSDETNGKLQVIRWSPSAFPLQFEENDRPADLVPEYARGSDRVGALSAALRPWALSPVGMGLAGTTSARNIAPEGINLISYSNTTANRDATRNVWAVTVIWTDENSRRIVEADIVLNPTAKFATNGDPTKVDLQSTLTHELGHALGLGHSPNIAATMFPYGDFGEIHGRTLEADDMGGLRSLYVGATTATLGAITGRVLTTAGAAVFGAHVTATDSAGLAQVGALTDWDGNFTIPGLTPGVHQVYAEPLDGPMTAQNLPDDYFHNRSHPVLARFDTTFAGGNAAPADVRVEAGKTTTLDPIKVETQPPLLGLDAYIWSLDWETWKQGTVAIQPGRALYLAILGPGVPQWSPGGFSVSGTGVGIDTSEVERGTVEGIPYLVLTLWSSGQARPGARNLYFGEGNRRTVLTGLIEPRQ